jgi:hypothetical protein
LTLSTQKSVHVLYLYSKQLYFFLMLWTVSECSVLLLWMIKFTLNFSHVYELYNFIFLLPYLWINLSPVNTCIVV